MAGEATSTAAGVSSPKHLEQGRLEIDNTLLKTFGDFLKTAELETREPGQGAAKFKANDRLNGAVSPLLKALGAEPVCMRLRASCSAANRKRAH